jgi:hypothetical protein
MLLQGKHRNIYLQFTFNYVRQRVSVDTYINIYVLSISFLSVARWLYWKFYESRATHTPRVAYGNL